MLRSSLALAVILCLAAPVAASASTASVDIDGRLTVTAAPGEANEMRIMYWDPAWPLGVRDKAGITGCHIFEPGWIQCGGHSPVVDLGDQDDYLLVNDDVTAFPMGAAKVTGGAGDDTITTAMSADDVSGGTGGDTIDGFLDDDVLRGEDGDDTLDGSFGSDRLIGGPGADTVKGGPDDDTIEVRDGERDVVRCHEGADKVTADRVDDLGADCETVDLPALETPRDEGKDEGSGTPKTPSTPTEPTTPATPAGPAGPKDLPRTGLPVPASSTVVPAATDRTAPRLKVVRVKRRRGITTLTVRCDEACAVTAKAGRRKTARTLLAGKPGRLVLRGRRIALTARDAAGNVTRKTVR